jgi:hypothetical protein
MGLKTWIVGKGNRTKKYFSLVALTVLFLPYNNCSKGGFQNNKVSDNVIVSESTVSETQPSSSLQPGQTSTSSTTPPAAPPVLPPRDFSTFKELVDTMPRNSWIEIKSKNTFSDVWPDAAFRMTNRLNAIVGPSAVINAWNGGAYGRGHLYFWGGGHADYAGNEIYSFDITDFQFKRHSNPSIYREANNNDCPNGACIPADGGPNSTHSYGGVAYINDLDSLWVGAGSPYHVGFGHYRPAGSQSGWGTEQSFVYSFGEKKWTHLLDLPIGGFDGSSGYDPISKLLIFCSLDMGGWAGLTVIDVHKNRIVIPRFTSGLGSNLEIGAYSKMLIIPEKRQVILSTGEIIDLSGLQVGGGSGSTLRILNEKNESWAQMETRLGMMETRSPGWAYDPNQNAVFLWDGGENLRKLNLDQKQWSIVRPTTRGPNQTGSVTGSRGVFGRFVYVPEHGVFVGYNDANGRPWVYRP